MINFWKMTYEAVKKQRNQYKAERDTLIDDIAVLKANISRLERENGQHKKEEKVNRTKASLLTEIEQLKQQLKGTREFFVDVTKRNVEQLDLLQDFSKFINYKLIVSPASDTYKHYRSELDKLGVK